MITKFERAKINWVSVKHRPKTPEELETLVQRLLGLSILVRVDRKTGCWVPVKESA